MGYCVTSPDREKVRQKKLTCTQKTASREIFSYCVKTSQENRSESPELHQENRLTATKTASGIPYWLGRDPIGERGGVNLYAFVGNDPVSRWDRLGLATAIISINRSVNGILGTYGTVTITSDNAEINRCCNLPKTFLSIEPPSGSRFRTTRNNQTRRGLYIPENTPIGGRGATSPSRLAQAFGVNNIQRPAGVSLADHNEGLGYEYHTAGGPINIHAGTSANSSHGCIIIGNNYCAGQLTTRENRFPGISNGRTYYAPVFNANDSLSAHAEFNSALSCIRRHSRRLNESFSTSTTFSGTPRRNSQHPTTYQVLPPQTITQTRGWGPFRRNVQVQVPQAIPVNLDGIEP